MLQIRSAVKFEDIELVLRAAAQKHNCNVLVVSHLGQTYSPGEATGAPDAFVFSICHTKLYVTLMAADVRFAGYLPCRIAAWPDAGGVMLQAMTPSEYCRLLGSSEMERVASPLEQVLRGVMEDSGKPLVATAGRQGAGPSTWGATEDMVNMRMTLPQRIDCRGTKVEDEGGTGTHDTLGG
jgi:uncharacterized protein (DUF302 family)